jgi:hypothetical protein
MTPTRPPTRPPHYIDNESHGWPLESCAGSLINALASWAHEPYEFRGHANGRIWRQRIDRTSARLLFVSDQGDGHIDLSIDASFWVRAELFVIGELKFRAWIDEPYEEKDFWPDGSDGITPPNGDPPGRISKRGRWLQFRRADFGLAPAESAFWDVCDIGS